YQRTTWKKTTSAAVPTVPVLIQPLLVTQQQLRDPMQIVGTSEDTPKTGTSSKPRGRPPKNRATAPSGPVLHGDNNRIILLFRLKHETNSVYFVEAKNKDHIHSGWVKVQESFNVIYDSAASIDQLRNSYQHYLREYLCF
ncbi:UNVERIFIED_CONTAM: hypothetical protein HDU68_005870, partial [Siphonaria sp. JEL0065]